MKSKAKETSSDSDLYDVLEKVGKIKTDLALRLRIEETAAEITKVLMAIGHALPQKIYSCLALILDYLNADKGSLMLVNIEDEEELVVVEAMSSGASNTRIIGKRQKLHNSVSGWVVKNKELLLVEDIHEDPRFDFDTPLRFKINYQSNSLLSLPLIDQQKTVIGVMNITDKKGNKVFTQRDIAASIIFADRITPTIAYSRLNEQLKKRNTELRDLQSLKGDLTNMVIHDIKGHVGEIYSNIDILTNYKGLAPNYKDCVDAALEGCENLLRLVLNLLDISKMEEGKVRLKILKFDIIEIFKNIIIKANALGVRKNLTLRIANKEESFTISADRNLIERVLDNLLLNAISYSRPDTVITLSVERKKEVTRLSVHDHGEGIPPALHKKIFEKFEQGAKNSGRYSTGLGLTFCKMVVERHKGEIWVDSEIGKGSTFCFSLPNSPKE